MVVVALVEAEAAEAELEEVAWVEAEMALAVAA